jgi:hypothetical protein
MPQTYRKEGLRLVMPDDRGSRARLRLLAFSVSAAMCLGSAKPLAHLWVVGTWEYRQRNIASVTLVDPEGERLVIPLAGEEVIIAYYGLEREGEHGLYYTAVHAADVQRANDVGVEFTVPARNLYRIRPKSIAHAATLESAGALNHSLRFVAERRGEVLVVTCTSDDGSCPESTMTFQRMPELQ